MTRILVPFFLLLTSFNTWAQEKSDLESGARGIIEKRCLACHNAELKTGDLILTSREKALKGGKNGPALVPNRPDESLMVRKISAGEMPPGNPLPDPEREMIRQWIEAGAPWTGTVSQAPTRPRAGLDWWSFQPLRNDPLPQPEGLPAEWSTFPIDRFIYAKLKDKGLQPSPPADRKTYIRRATFDLLGLPPTPEEVKAFVADKSRTPTKSLSIGCSPHRTMVKDGGATGWMSSVSVRVVATSKIFCATRHGLSEITLFGLLTRTSHSIA